jgi:hypothetical protein
MDRPDDLFESYGGVIRIARFGPVFAGIYGSPLTADAFDEVLHWQRPLMPSEPILQFSLAFSAHRLQPDVQAAADRLLTEYGPRTCGSATVLTASGFQASAARAMLATIYLLTRVSYPRRVFAEISEAEAWLVSLGKYERSIAASAMWLTEAVAARAAQAAATPPP